jgi:hypothetical protein
MSLILIYVLFPFLSGKFRGKRTDVFISLFINRVSAVDESKEVSKILLGPSHYLWVLHGVDILWAKPRH